LSFLLSRLAIYLTLVLRYSTVYCTTASKRPPLNILDFVETGVPYIYIIYFLKNRRYRELVKLNAFKKKFVK
jgi:hypothetical protein